ncbi:MAG: hypothetical protein O7G32_12405 [SAR324 cluster bacterium]|nr:hypothetical protein [SAR324 cluster bacterium]
MFKWIGNLISSEKKGPDPWRVTERADWETLNRELFVRVVEGGQFCIGIISAGEIGDGELKFRMNLEYPNKEVTKFIRESFKPTHMQDVFFARVPLKIEPRHGLLKVASNKLGLPINTLLCPVSSNAEPELQLLVLFGGEFVDNQMDSRLHALHTLLIKREPHSGSQPSGPAKDAKSLDELLALLDETDGKRLFSRRLEDLAEIVNGLEEIKEQLSVDQKAKFGTLSHYLVQKRFG